MAKKYIVCFDEVPYQMVSETKLPLPMRNGKPGRYDFEYRREGTCNLFMFLQDLKNEFRRNHISASHQLLRGTAVDDPPDALTHHLGISANTPQPWYSRV